MGREMHPQHFISVAKRAAVTASCIVPCLYSQQQDLNCAGVDVVEPTMKRSLSLGRLRRSLRRFSFGSGKHQNVAAGSLAAGSSGSSRTARNSEGDCNANSQ